MKVKGGELSSMEQFRGILETLEERNVLQTVCTGNKNSCTHRPFYMQIYKKASHTSHKATET